MMTATVGPSSQFEPVAALLIPKNEMSVVLRALNSMHPRWGSLISAQVATAGGPPRTRKGVHIPNPRDESSEALRAIELPSPLDERIAAVSDTSCKGYNNSVEQTAEDHLLNVPDALKSLLQSRVAVFQAHFQPPCELDDMHPCPEPLPEWIIAGEQVLPAQDAQDPPGNQTILQSDFSRFDGCSCKPGSFRFIELFAGIGGFRVALEALGGTCVFASEIHPTARAVYQENWPNVSGDSSASGETLGGDIRLVPADEVLNHDILTAGFPCQPFSALGKQDGIEDRRGLLFLHVCRLLRIKRPLAAVLENVPGLLDTNDGAALAAVLQELRASGYRVAHRVYNSKTILAQKRKRVYIVAIRADLEEACEHFRFPWLPELNRVLRDVLELPAPPAEELPHLLVSGDRWARVKASSAFAEAPEDIIGDLDRPAAPLVSSYGDGGSGQYARYTQLIPAAIGSDDAPRRLSSRECGRLQGFPESFKRSSCDGPKSWYRLIGNAVSPPVVCAITGALLCALRHCNNGRSRCLLPGSAPSLRLVFGATSVGEIQRLMEREIIVPSEDCLALKELIAGIDKP